MAAEHKSYGNGDVKVDVGVDPETTPLQLNRKSSPLIDKGSQPEKQKESHVQTDLIFPVESFPPWYITLIYAFQVSTSSSHLSWI